MTSKIERQALSAGTPSTSTAIFERVAAFSRRETDPIVSRPSMTMPSCTRPGVTSL